MQVFYKKLINKQTCYVVEAVDGTSKKIMPIATAYKAKEKKEKGK